MYEDEHADMLTGFIEQHAEPHAEVIIIDAGRSYCGQFTKKMEKLGFTSSRTTQTAPEELTSLIQSKRRFQIMQFDR